MVYSPAGVAHSAPITRRLRFDPVMSSNWRMRRADLLDPDIAYQRRWLTLLVLCTSLIVITLDNTILNVALPTLSRPPADAGLGASASQLQWIVDSYVIVRSEEHTSE